MMRSMKNPSEFELASLKIPSIRIFDFSRGRWRNLSRAWQRAVWGMYKNRLRDRRPDDGMEKR